MLFCNLIEFAEILYFFSYTVMTDSLLLILLLCCVKFTLENREPVIWRRGQVLLRKG